MIGSGRRLRLDHHLFGDYDFLDDLFGDYDLFRHLNGLNYLLGDDLFDRHFLDYLLLHHHLCLHYLCFGAAARRNGEPRQQRQNNCQPKQTPYSNFTKPYLHYNPPRHCILGKQFYLSERISPGDETERMRPGIGYRSKLPERIDSHEKAFTQQITRTVSSHSDTVSRAVRSQLEGNKPLRSPALFHV